MQVKPGTPYQPFCINLENLPVLVVGGGNQALRKIRDFQLKSARITVVAPVIHPDIEALAAEEKILLIRGVYCAGCLEGQRLVFCCTSDPAINHQILLDAEECSILAGGIHFDTAARLMSCAVVEQSPLLIGISTTGAAPLLARTMRELLEELVMNLGPVGEEFIHVREVKGMTSSEETLRLKNQLRTLFLEALERMGLS
jgi:uroporphyrin-III C-methyltransferase/precorrin-2 dehydrogenase/sirohydrochlorin ferrochelatase